MRTFESPGTVAFHPRVLGLPMIVLVLLGACSGVGPTSAGASDPETPAAPATSAGTRGQTSVTVAWTPPAAEPTLTGYELRWRSNAGADWTNVTGISSTETSYTITGLQPQTTYEVQVRALSATTVGAWSEPITISTMAPPAPEVPRLSESAAGSNSISVTWTAPVTDETITGYELNWRSSAEVEWTKKTGISSTETSYTIDELQPQTTYEVRVRALFAATAGAWSESIAVSTATPPARPPAQDRPRLSLTAVNGDSVTVGWVAPAIGTSITSYQVRVRGGSLTKWKRFAGISSTRTGYTIEGLQRRTTYQVQVRAMFGGVAGSWSAILTCTTSAYLDPPPVRFSCPCQFTIAEDVAAARKGMHAHLAGVWHFTPETFPATIRYEVSETGDMLESASKGVFETPNMSLEGLSYGFFVYYPRIRLPIIDDDVDEPNSTITVQILPDPRYRVDYASSSKITITDDDDPPSLEVNDVTVTEGDSGTVNAMFTVSLSTASGWTVTVDWATSDGTATAGADYTAGSGTLTFAAGETGTTFDVAVTGDTVDEDDETFTVTLSNADHASIPDATGTGTITDDD